MTAHSSAKGLLFASTNPEQSSRDGEGNGNYAKCRRAPNTSVLSLVLRNAFPELRTTTRFDLLTYEEEESSCKRFQTLARSLVLEKDRCQPKD
jgi:hypothetical protein